MRLGGSENAGKIKRFDDEFKPLAMDHEGMHTPFVVLRTLLGASGLLRALTLLFQRKTLNMLVYYCHVLRKCCERVLSSTINCVFNVSAVPTSRLRRNHAFHCLCNIIQSLRIKER